MRKGGEYALIGVGAFIVIAAILVSYYKYFALQQCQLVYMLHSTNFKLLKEGIYAVMATQRASLTLHLPDKYTVSLSNKKISVSYEGMCNLLENTSRTFSYDLPFNVVNGITKGKNICLENDDGKLRLC